MRLRWSPDASNDLQGIYDRIREDNPSAAHEVIRELFGGCKALKVFPNRGRRGREPGTRELVFSSLPYIVVYRVTRTHIEISRIWHGAQGRTEQ